MSIKIIYYAYLFGKDWQSVIYEQLGGLKQLDLYNEAENIYLNVSGEEKNIDEFRNIVNGHYPKMTIDRVTTENQFEYPGIRSLYDHAQSNPQSLYLYFHTKGVVSKSHDYRRKLFRYTIENYKQYLDIFNRNPDINLMGICPSVERWIWFNFFWVRGSCVLTAEPPKITDRYYYESWIGRNNSGDVKACDFAGDFKWLHPIDACHKLLRLP
jgi:hypothetical protein